MTRIINKKRQKAGHHELDIGKRSTDEVILLVLECVHDESVTGTTAREIMNRSEINYYYFKQISKHLLQNQFIQQWKTMDNPDDENSDFHLKFFLTQKGSELYEYLKAELGAIGFVPKLGDKRV